MRTHGGSKATIYLENGELIENGRVIDLIELLIRDDLLGCGRVDLIPVTAKAQKDSTRTTDTDLTVQHSSRVPRDSG